MANSKLTLDNNKSYLVGAQYINGPYEFTDAKTGELKSGITDKWVLSFLEPQDRNEKVKAVGGVKVSVENVKAANICYIVGKMPEDFKPEDILNLVGSAVVIDRTVINNRPVLRGIVTIN